MHNKKININKSKNFIQGLRPFSSSIPHGIKKILKKGGYNLSHVVDNWSKIVGETVSNDCYPVSVKIGKKLQNGVLILNVIHGKEVNIEYNKKDMIDKINVFFGYDYISQIKLKIVREKKVIKEKKSINNLMKLKFKEKLETVSNKELKQSLNKLITAFKIKND